MYASGSGVPVVETVGLEVRLGAVTALCDITVAVPAGTVIGVLGHNGAGKTTLVRALAGLVSPARGEIRVGGVDVVRDPTSARRRLGVVGQQAAVDETMTGRENLEMVGRLLGASRARSRTRATELMEEFDVTEHADRPARVWSGGLRRRLDLACALVGRPEVVLLDEPTTGLDPVSRDTLWSVIERRVAEGAAVVLTTQYLQEADRLANRLLVLGRGRAVATGSPEELKARFGRRRARLDLGSEADAVTARTELARTELDAVADRGRLTVSLDRPGAVAEVVRCLDLAGLDPHTLEVHEPTLDDVYRALHESETSPGGARATEEVG